MYPFTAITAAYNSAKFLPDTIQSMQKQTVGQWQMIIIDDGSTDNTFQIASMFKSDPRIKVFRLPRNMGVGFAKAYAAELASGDIIGILDSDDTLEPNAVKTIIDYYHKENVEFAHTMFRFCDQNLQPQKHNGKDRLGSTGMPEKYDSFLDYTIANPHDCHVSLMLTFTQGIYQRSAKMSPHFKNAVDKDLVLKLEEAGASMNCIPEVLYNYRRHSNSLGSTKKHDCMPQIIFDAQNRRSRIQQEEAQKTWDQVNP